MIEHIISKNTCTRQDVDTNLEKKFSQVRVETNFERLPIWSPKPKRGTVFVPSKTIELEPEVLSTGEIVERKIKIVPTAEYGYPTVQTQEYWYALQKLWHESPDKETGRIEFSITQLLKILSKSDNTNSRRSAKLAIEQLAGTLFQFHYLLYKKENDDLITEERGFSLLINYSIAERKTNSSTHDKCSVTLHPLIVSNLRSGYFKPIILSTISQLKSDIARLLYRKLDLQFSHYSKYEISTERFFKEQGLQGSDYHKPSVRKRLLEKAIKELLEKPTSSGAIIDSYQIISTADGKDLKLIVRARGITKREKKYQHSSATQETTSSVSTVTKTQKISQELTPEVKEILDYFDTIFEGTTTPRTPKVATKAKEVITQHGLDFTKYFIRFAATKAKQTKYDVKTFNGIIKYLEEAITTKAQEEQATKIRKEQVIKEQQQLARDNIYKRHREEYEQYVCTLAEGIFTAQPEEQAKFSIWEQQEVACQLSKVEGKKVLFETLKSHLAKKEQQIIRIAKYFEGHGTIKIPDFWQWYESTRPTH